MRIEDEDDGPDGLQDLSPTQALAVTALASGQTTTEATRVAGVSRQTVHARQELPSFRAEMNTLRAESLASVRGELLALARTAVRSLRELVESPTTPPLVRLRAIELVLADAANQTAGPTDARAIAQADRDRARSRARDDRRLAGMEACLDRMLDTMD